MLAQPPQQTPADAAYQGLNAGASGLLDGKQQEHGPGLGHGMEIQLRMQIAYLEQVWQLHAGVKARLQVLEQGLEWKDAQLDDHARMEEEARASCAAWQERSERLEEENAVLRDALLEGNEQNKYLRHLLEVRTKEKLRAQEALWACQQQAQQRQPASGRSPAEQEYVDSLNQKLKETKERMILLEEQLRMQSALDKDAALEEVTCTQNQMSVSPADAWAAVGRGAADRICGGTPHIAGNDEMPSKAVADTSGDAPQQDAPASTRGPDTDQSEVSTTPQGTARTQVSMVLMGDDELGDPGLAVSSQAQQSISSEALNIDVYERRHSEGSTPMSTIEEHMAAHGIARTVSPMATGLPPGAVVAPQTVPSWPSAPPQGQQQLAAANYLPYSLPRNYQSGRARVVCQPQVPRFTQGGNTPSRQRGAALPTLPRGQT